MGTEGVGDVYVNSFATGDTDPYRAETGSVTLFYLRILAEKTAIYVGRQGSQTYPVKKDTMIELWNVDLADLYFRNEGTTGVLHLLGTTKT